MDSSVSMGFRRLPETLTGTESTGAVRKLQSSAQHNTGNDKKKIEKAARDFESILIGQWLEQAEKSFATVPGEDPDAKNRDPGEEQMRSIAFHSLAEGLTRAGGIGIASMIARRLESESGPGTHADPEPVASPRPK